MDKKLLKQNALTMEDIWKRNGESEEENDIWYREETDEPEVNNTTVSPNQLTGTTIHLEDSNGDNSENIPLARAPKDDIPPRKI